MSVRKRSCRHQAGALKQKAWKKLVSIAFSEDTDQTTVAALEAIIDIAEANTDIEMEVKNNGV